MEDSDSGVIQLGPLRADVSPSPEQGMVSPPGDNVRTSTPRSPPEVPSYILDLERAIENRFASLHRENQKRFKEIQSENYDARKRLDGLNMQVQSLRRCSGDDKNNNVLSAGNLGDPFYSEPREVHRNRAAVPIDINRERSPEGRYEGYGSSLKSIKMKPSPYDGTEDLEDYLTHFSLVSDVNKWNDQQKALMLASSLTGRARTLLNDLTPRQHRDYGALVHIWISKPS
ncbi:hypothetical protein SNE40_018455 [Patella caerulea]|uniref:Uncharacterized protein n=1 Tax=Patella caerulea TaxID=87958 RepID=A0AAN8J7B2_PATCE